MELKFNNESIINSLLTKLANAELKSSQFESVIADLVKEKEELLKTIKELKADKK